MRPDVITMTRSRDPPSSAFTDKASETISDRPKQDSNTKPIRTMGNARTMCLRTRTEGTKT